MGLGLTVALTSIKGQKETQGRAPFLRALTRHATCMPSRRQQDALMLAPVKPRIRRGWDLVSRIGHIKTHQTTARNLGKLSISERASYATSMSGGCNSQIRVVMLEDLVGFCNQFIDMSHSILMLFIQASTELIRQLHHNFQQSESKLPQPS
jgi:hypothetical protein